MRTPAKPIAEWPINEEIFPDDIGPGKISPHSGIRAVQGIVSHDHVMFRPHRNDSIRRISEPWRELVIKHVSRKMTFPRRLVWIKGINILKMRSVFIEALAVNNQMPILADLHFFVTQGHQPLDVKLVLLIHAHAFNASGFKYN